MDLNALRRFDLNLVKVFLAIWEARSLTGAGISLGLTQPAISHGLKRLRETFDDPLFVRVGHRMEPTETATALHASFHEALRLLGGSVRTANSFDPAGTGRVFRVAMTDTGEFVILPRLLAAMEREAPQAALHTVRADPAEVEAALRSGQVDMAIGYQPQLENGACRGTVLLTDRLVCLLRAGHPALARDWSREAFGRLSFLDVGRAATGHRMARDLLEQQGVPYPIKARLEHFTVLPEIVRRTDYAAIFPRSVFELMQGRDGLAIRDLPFPIPSYEVKIWVHGQFASDPGIGWLGALVGRAMERPDVQG
ncbi:LysR substrate-binding domain-containing protein [Paracoccus sp. (in: a-proteobacteria)]|uniref:LysR substrate-binding domain-containing protein n=1 Tax=Paracoccus sp. TaxID=267 RepID=UPI003A8A9E6B